MDASKVEEKTEPKAEVSKYYHVTLYLEKDLTPFI